MTEFSRYISLLYFSVLIFIVGYVLAATGLIDVSSTDLAIGILVFASISFSTLIIFFKGQKKEPASQTMHTLLAISLKLLLELLFALLWFLLAKKSSYQFIVLFFVLYLAFTFYSVFIILKTLKNISIDNNF